MYIAVVGCHGKSRKTTYTKSKWLNAVIAESGFIECAREYLVLYIVILLIHGTVSSAHKKIIDCKLIPFIFTYRVKFLDPLPPPCNHL